jgi:hypothetical protein
MEETIKILSNFIRFDIKRYLDTYISFIENDYPKLEDFYLGKVENKDQNSQNHLNFLIQKSNELDNLLQLNLNNFTRGDYVFLMESIDEVYYNLKKINHISKFLKSSLIEKVKSSTITVDRIVKNYETPEYVIEKERIDWQDNWVDVYIKNRKLETEYEYNEGYFINLNKSIFTNFTLDSVIDNLQGENLFGKDIDKIFDFIDNDFITLNGIDTFKQAVAILANLEKRDIPQFPEFGLDRELTKGMYEINLPLIIREKQKDFSIDDTILGFAINDISKINGKLEVKFEAQSFYSTVAGEVIKV